MLKFPDILRHKNNNYALVDIEDVRGGCMPVADETARNSIPIDKRKLRMIVSYNDGSQEVTKKYLGADVLDINWSNNVYWEDIVTSTGVIDVTAVHKITPNEFPVITEKVDVVDDDIILGEDSESTPTVFQKIKIKIGSILNKAKAYADSLVLGLWDDRGNYDASSNVFPSSGGSGESGAILKGDIWTISVGGTLGGEEVVPGQTVRALADAPGQTDVNWAISLAGGNSISDTPQPWSPTIQFNGNYGSFNTNKHTQTVQIDFSVSFASAAFGAVTSRTIISNGDDFTFPSGYIAINTDGSTGSRVLNVFTPIEGRQYRVVFECVDVANEKYNAVILDWEEVSQLNDPVISSVTPVSGSLDVDLVFTDANSYPPEFQIEVEFDTVNTFDSGNEVSTLFPKNSTSATVTVLSTNTLYYFRVRAVGDGVNTESSVWSNIESATTPIGIVLFSEQFTGTSIDVLNTWNKIDPDTAFSQNDELLIDRSLVSPSNYYMNSRQEFGNTGLLVMRCYLETAKTNNNSGEKSLFGFADEIQDLQKYNIIGVQYARDDTVINGDVRLNISGSGVSGVQENVSLPSNCSILTGADIKIVIDFDNDTQIFYGWDTVALVWVQFGSTGSVTINDTLFIHMQGRDCVAIPGETAKIDNIMVSDFDYVTLNPV